MERNSDLVIMASYAPLLVNVNPSGMQWQSDLIGYNAFASYGSPSYYAQAMFATHIGTEILSADIGNTSTGPDLASLLRRHAQPGQWHHLPQAGQRLLHAPARPHHARRRPRGQANRQGVYPHGRLHRLHQHHCRPPPRGSGGEHGQRHRPGLHPNASRLFHPGHGDSCSLSRSWCGTIPKDHGARRRRSLIEIRLNSRRYAK